jgi:hypothetical protein
MESSILACAREVADVVIYDTPAMANIAIDYVEGNMVAKVNEINSLNKSIAANGVRTTFDLTVSFTQQADFENTASNNSAIMARCNAACDRFLIQLVKTGFYIMPDSISVEKHQEGINDANHIGWTMTMELELVDGYAEC